MINSGDEGLYGGRRDLLHRGDAGAHRRRSGEAAGRRRRGRLPDIGDDVKAAED